MIKGSSLSFLWGLAALLIMGCTSAQRTGLGGVPPRASDRAPLAAEQRGAAHVDPTPVGAARYPWETWVFARDFDGFEITMPEILHGDELARRDRNEEALKSYEAAKAKPMIQSERFALLSRIASMHLREERHGDALVVLTRFFEAEQMGADQVPARIALIFGYAYGMRGDPEQAIAWFSQSGRSAGGPARGGILAESSARGIRGLVHHMSDEQFDDTAALWRADAFVSEVIARERHARAARRDTQFGSEVSFTGNRFWERDLLDPRLSGERSVVAPTAEQYVVAFLPLSGPYASLGDQVKSGIELAFLGRPEGGVQLEIVDTRGESYEAVSRFREITAQRKPDFVIGPLLSDVAVSLADEARRVGVPVIAFSKRDYFPVGGGIFRLGATTQSQVASLIHASVHNLNLQRHAIIFPRTELGEHFANAYREELYRQGGRLIFEASFNEQDSHALVDLSRQAERERVDAIFMPTRLEVAGRFWTNVQPHVRREVHLLGPASWYNPVALRNSRAALEGATFISPFFTQSEKDIVKRFIESFRNYFQAPPDFLAAQGFDAATLVLSALERSVQTTIPASELLPRISGYNGLTGSIRIHSSGEIIRDFSVVRMSGGQLREVERQVSTPSFSAIGDEVLSAPMRRGTGAPSEYDDPGVL